MAHAGFTYTATPAGPTTYAGLYTAPNFSAGATTPNSNFRAYSSILSAAGTNDNASFASTAAAPFTSSTDLHIPNSTVTLLESGGASGTGVATDIDGDGRPNGTAPDIGADEFSGIVPPANDIAANAFVAPTNGASVVNGSTVTPQASFSNVGTATQTNIGVSFTITGPGGYNYTNSQVIATLAPNATTTVTFAAAPAFTTAGAYTMSAAVTTPDANVANDAINGSFTVADPLNGNYTVGTGGNYTSLTNPGGIFDAINGLGATGNIVINITSDLTSETGTVALNQIAGGFTVNVQASGAARAISGSNATGLINLNGADGVTFSGLAFGPFGLTITNNGTGSVFRYINDATGNSVVGCSVAASGGSAILYGTGTTTGNDNNSVTSSFIHGVSSSVVPVNSIASVGTSAAISNSTLTFTSNQITDFSGAGITIANSDNLSIVGNNITQTASRTTQISGMSIQSLGTNSITSNQISGLRSSVAAGTAYSTAGMFLFDVRGTTVSNNRIFDFPAVAGGTGRIVGIEFAGDPVGAANATLTNNFVSISPTVTTANTVFGIFDFAYGGNTVTIDHNSIYIGGTASGSASSWALHRGSAAPTAFTARNNIAFNNRTGGTGSHFAGGDESGNTGTFVSNGNFFVGTGATAANFMLYNTTAVSFATWKNGPPSRDANSFGNTAASFTVANIFVNAAAGDLHVLGTAGQILGGGRPGIAPGADIDGNTRDANTPDIGADELFATLTIIKTVVNDNGGTAVAGAFGGTIGGTSAATYYGGNTWTGTASPGQVKTVITGGAYDVTETAAPGYTTAYSADCTGTLAAGDAKTCTVTNDDIAPATLTIIKSVTNNNGGSAVATDFGGTIVGGATFTGGNTWTGSATGQIKTSAAGGAYNVQETAAAGYQVSYSTDCQGTLNPGDNKTCTVTNDDIAGVLTIVKTVVNDNGGTAVASAFGGSISGATFQQGTTWTGSATGQQFTTATLGAYNVTENSAPGYSVTYSADCMGTIALGDTKTCTVTNDDQPGTLTVIKHVVNDNGGSATASDFTMTVAGGTPSSFPGAESPGTAVTLNAGSYSVGETGPSGYSRSDSTDCSGTIANGESKTCTITNDDQAATLVIVKNVILDNGGTAVAGDFSGTIGGAAVFSGGNTWTGTGSPGQSKVATTLGGYSVSENPAPGYTASFSTDCTGTLALGETKTCTVTNDDNASSANFSIDDVTLAEGNGPGTTAFTFTIEKVGSTAQVTSVQYATAPGSASSPGDYAAISGTATFQPADTQVQVTVQVVGDLVYEGTEDFFVNLSGASNAGITDNQGKGTITEDDPQPVFDFSFSNNIEDESQTARVMIHRTGNTNGTATINFSTAASVTPPIAVGGTCGTGGADFKSETNQVVTFGDGVEDMPGLVQICPDTQVEPTEHLSVALSATTTGAVGTTRPTAALDINDTAAQYLQTPAHTSIPITFATNSPVSTITVSGAPNILGGIRVTLYDYYTVNPDNVDVLLVGPGGQAYMLMADVGGGAPILPGQPITLTFSDAAALPLANAGPLGTGTFLPTTCEAATMTPFANGSPAPPYIEPGCAGPPRPQAKTMFGVFPTGFGNTNPNGDWKLYVRDDAGVQNRAGSPENAVGEIKGGWGLEITAPTASDDISVSGRVVSAEGRGIANAKVSITGNTLMTPITAVTGRSGQYVLNGLRAGETYVITVGSRRFIFEEPSRIITLTDNLTGVDFTASGGR